MAKDKMIFVCQNCGSERPKWEGQCRDCGAWNSLVEEKQFKPAKGARGWSIGTNGGAGAENSSSLKQSVRNLSEDFVIENKERWATGMTELDRVLGGGLVRGSYILLGGDPGIGKSTLLMQLSGELAKQGRTLLYVSAEESVEQTALRAERLGISTKTMPKFIQNIHLASESHLTHIQNLVDHVKPDVMIVDSIQTVYLPELSSAPGTVSQVRECAAHLMALAKSQGIVVFLVGHVTKDGNIAGPKTLEHMVDTVLSFEGDSNHQFRLLRAQKNRFGPTNELGVFQMDGSGLVEVSNPSELFLAERGTSLIGSAVFAAMEGTRPLLCEVQSLTTTTYMSMPRRTAIGLDPNRVHLLCAVLEKHLNMEFSRLDVFVNVVGGLKLTEPAADLSVAATLISSIQEVEMDPNAAFIGEVGLTGEVRAATFIVERVREVTKLGFKRVVIPSSNKKHIERETKKLGVEIIYVKNVDDLMSVVNNLSRELNQERSQKQKSDSRKSVKDEEPELDF